MHVTGDDLFWTDPPWRGGHGGYRMGLAPIADEAWLPDAISGDELARKRALLSRSAPPVFAALPETEQAQQRVYDAVCDRRQATTGIGDSPTNSLSDDSLSDGTSPAPLARAALLVPEDLCMMQLEDGRYRLVAACVCAPSYWSLAEKIGRTLTQIHAPVPALEEKLGARMHAFFQRLPASTAFERRNWFLHLDDEPFQPRPEAWPRSEAIDPARLVMRSERQTLKQMADDLILFTIQVSCRPFAQITGYPEAMADLLTALTRLDNNERAATGFHCFGPAVMHFLRSHLDASTSTNAATSGVQGRG